MIERGLLICLTGLIYGAVLGQQKLVIRLHPNTGNHKSEKTIFLPDTSFQTLQKKLRKFTQDLSDQGHAAVSVDSLVKKDSTWNAVINPGPKFFWAFVHPGKTERDLLRESGFKERLFLEKEFDYQRLVRIQHSLLKVCENNGYPFARVKLDSVQFSGDSVSGILHLEKGPFYALDSVCLRGNAEVSEPYLKNYLGIRAGDPYREDAVMQVSNRIKEIPFIKEIKPGEVAFYEQSCKLLLYLEKKKASQFAGIIGIASDEKNPGRLLWMGDVNLRLINPFGGGEHIELNWRSPGRQTQDLKTRLVYPFIISKFGLDLRFDIFKRDTTFVEVTKEFGVQYLLPAGNFLKAFVNQKNSNLQSTKGLEFVTTLPEYADVSTTVYGLGIRHENLDYRINPRKGTALTATGAAGWRTIEKNPKINEVVYDSIDLKTVQYEGTWTGDWFLPLSAGAVFHLGYSGGRIFNDRILMNELFRIGGLKTLRGFDEMSMLVSAYDILTIEWRYLLEENSHFGIFWNGAYIENLADRYSGDRFDTPYGFGAVLAFDTRLGMFSLVYALGSQAGQGPQLKSGKFHFGIINRF